MTRQPLELAYRWQTPVAVSSVAAIVLASLLVRGDSRGWLPVVAVVVALWLVFLLVVWLRTRAYLAVQGSVLAVRRYRDRHELAGPDVVRVKEYLTGHGPCYKVWVAGRDRPIHVPAALLRRGHSTFFGWLTTWAPTADLDPGSRRTLDRLRERGLVG